MLEQQVEKLLALLVQEETALKDSQQRIQQLRNQVVELQTNIAGAQIASPGAHSLQETSASATRLDSQVSALREEQDLQQSEIATHEQTKVESASRYPLKLTGLIVVNGFANSSRVDVIQAPTVAGSGAATAGFSLRQSVLGLDARGPHVFGAASSADLRVDFFGGQGQGSYLDGGGTARFRTAHAELTWEAARAFFEVDRPILNPGAPDSLTAIAQPEMAWSGNLWNWIPQVGAEYYIASGGSTRIAIQGALVDVPDPPAFRASSATPQASSLAEQSRRPGSELRVGYNRGDKVTGLQLGLGGYFSPHRDGSDFSFNAWAATIDYRIPIASRLELSGNAYRGAALGGLGAGLFKDYVYHHSGTSDSYSALNDVGGWAQLQARAGQRLVLNTAYGLDNAFVQDLRPYLTSGSGYYQNLARNSTIMSNAIYSPTAYTLFSVEYRRIDSSPAIGKSWVSNVYGVAAGYRF